MSRIKYDVEVMDDGGDGNYNVITTEDVIEALMCARLQAYKINQVRVVRQDFAGPAICVYYADPWLCRLTSGYAVPEVEEKYSKYLVGGTRPVIEGEMLRSSFSTDYALAMTALTQER